MYCSNPEFYCPGSFLHNLLNTFSLLSACLAVLFILSKMVAHRKDGVPMALQFQITTSMFDAFIHGHILFSQHKMLKGICTYFGILGIVGFHAYSLFNLGIVVSLHETFPNGLGKLLNRLGGVIGFLAITDFGLLIYVLILGAESFSPDEAKCLFTRNLWEEHRVVFFILQLMVIPIISLCILVPSTILIRQDLYSKLDLPSNRIPLLPESIESQPICLESPEIRKLTIYPIAFFSCHIGSTIFNLTEVFYHHDTVLLYIWFQFGTSILGAVNAALQFVPSSLFAPPIPTILEPTVVESGPPKPTQPIPIPYNKNTPKYFRTPQTIEDDFVMGSSRSIIFEFSVEEEGGEHLQ